MVEQLLMPIHVDLQNKYMLYIIRVIGNHSNWEIDFLAHFSAFSQQYVYNYLFSLTILVTQKSKNYLLIYVTVWTLYILLNCLILLMKKSL